MCAATGPTGAKVLAALARANQRAAVPEAEASHLRSSVSDLTMERDCWRDQAMRLALAAPRLATVKRDSPEVIGWPLRDPSLPLVQEPHAASVCSASAAAMRLRRYCERTMR